ncbi:peptidyl-prolyl cis-trans isomerase [Tropicimonas sp. S265A]|uniref:peptidylprolyl isomerase n=1 Tax=Tropicimonas sp. S265A TaxID=3415134 RepID=UPI003C7A5366
MIQFFALGAGLFALFWWVDDAPPQPDRAQLDVSVQDARWLADQFAATWRRAPTAEELDALIDTFIAEEVYVREALALGLDQGDAIVRRRLRQKMEFLTEAGAEAAIADDAVLRTFYDQNQAQFTRPGQVGFSQVLLSDASEETLRATLARLQAGEDPRALGARTLLQPAMPPSSAQAVDATFGAGFFDQVATLETGIWAGPVTSGFGTHLVRVNESDPETLVPFEEVRDRVELAWRASMAQDLRAARYEGLVSQYDITRPDPAMVLGQ